MRCALPNYIEMKRIYSLFILCGIFCFTSTNGYSQNFEIEPLVCDSIDSNNYFIHVSGYALFTDSMIIHVELVQADSLATVVYSASKDFGVGGTSTLTNFTYDPLTDYFQLDIGTYTNRQYQIHIWSEVLGELKEELIIDTFEQ